MASRLLQTEMNVRGMVDENGCRKSNSFHQQTIKETKMRKLSVTVLLLLVGAGLLMYAYADQEHGETRGYGYGLGMGYGMGPGMGGMGYGMGPEMGGMAPFWGKIPEDKREQITQLHFSISRAMIVKMSEVREKGIELREALNKFPVDQKAAEVQWEALNRAQDEAFKPRLGMIAQVQQILGEQLWEKMSDGQMRRPYNRFPNNN